MEQRDRTNRTKAAAARGETVFVPEINRVFDPVVVELIAAAGYGCAWVDMEHSHASLDRLSSMILAARTVGLDLFVRIPHGPYNQVIKPLELGAAGLIWPHCRSAEEARRFVRMGKFQPLGLRGMGGGRDSRYGADDTAGYLDRANEQTLLGVMIEDAEGVEAAGEIAAVEGIDLLFVGPGDLSHSCGTIREPGKPHLHAPVLAAYERVGAACRANGKVMGTAADPGAEMAEAVRLGVRWLNCCHELRAVTAGYGNALAESKAVVDNQPAAAKSERSDP